MGCPFFSDRFTWRRSLRHQGIGPGTQHPMATRHLVAPPDAYGHWYPCSCNRTVPATPPWHNVFSGPAMTFRRLVVTCACGRYTSRIRDVWLTAAQQLVLRSSCPACKRRIYATKSLSDLSQDCPPAPAGEEVSEPTEESAADAQFLRSLGIVVPEGQF